MQRCSWFFRYLLVTMTLALGISQERVWGLELGDVTIETQEQVLQLEVEIARTAQERAYGLMERDALPENAGMLFVYKQQQSPDSGFWMYRTRIPLDIAFIGSEGTIRAIDSMVPCGNDVSGECPSYRAGVPFSMALEVNAGYFKKHGVEVGDHIELP